MSEGIKVYDGDVIGTGLKFGIVVSRFNELITKSLLDGATEALRRHGVKPEDIEVAWVPGAFEIPLVAKRLASSGRFDGICSLGAVIRGGTPHFDYVAGQVASGVATVALETGVPVSFGVLTTDTIEQAIERSGTKAGNKGIEAAVSCIETIRLLRKLPEGRR